MKLLGLSSLTAAAALAFAPASASAAVDFSGFWVLKSDPAAVPAAASTPAAAKKVKELLDAKGLNAPNGSPEYARLWCTAEGMPYELTHDLPINVRQGPLTLTMTFTQKTDARHIYLDGQKHPDPDVFDFTSNGNSIGHWEGNTLVADTIEFKDGLGVAVIPGGALRSEKTHLVEKFELVNPDTMRVTYTWTDPTTLRRPHTYTWEFGRVKGVWITESQCDPLPNMRAKGMPLPPDAQ